MAACRKSLAQALLAFGHIALLADAYILAAQGRVAGSMWLPLLRSWVGPWTLPGLLRKKDTRRLADAATRVEKFATRVFEATPTTVAQRPPGRGRLHDGPSARRQKSGQAAANAAALTSRVACRVSWTVRTK